MAKSAPAEVPSHFLCPISLHLMRDPVTLPTGISYDRAAISRWLAAPSPAAAAGRACPVTRLPLDPEPQLTPNHTLRRLIHSWLTSLAPGTHVDDDVAVMRAPVLSRDEVAALLSDAAAAQVSALKKLRELVSESENARAAVESHDGVFDALSRVVSSNDACTTAREEAVVVLASLRVPEQDLVRLAATHGSNLAAALAAVLRSPNPNPRAWAALLVRSLSEAAWPAWVIGLGPDLLAELVRVARDRVSPRATKAALHALAALCPHGRTRVRIVAAGAVHALVDLLLDNPDRRVCELALAVLDRLCTCAEGRAELVAHAAGLAVVGKKVLRVSEAATERAVRVLRSVARHAATPGVLQEMTQAGVVAKLCVAARSEQCGVRTRERAHEVLKLHSRVWRSSPCLPPKYLALYPL
ncbi:hypothetical protein QOZ80_1BG0091030 [Eleusine coracana subsp. coracana]|nr:hypothetical protein QOZ80_1BG0091030 [Eleusine coracana subsp. coracana]